MFSEEINKIAKLIKRFNPNLSEEELNKKAQELWNLAVFFVKLRVKQHSKPQKTQNLGGSIPITDKPP